jgi:hypothetical protein
MRTSVRPSKLAREFHRLLREYERLPQVLSGLHFLVFALLMLPAVAQMLASTGSAYHAMEPPTAAARRIAVLTDKA